MNYVDRIRRGEIAPWVGNGADGARRSAQIARDEMATLPIDNPRWSELQAQAAAWDERAEQ